ncbi:hypothetical protein [Croceimicrobium hydrocarbonivorans]|uniref:Leucine-rich repeat domain-containing protein n=1 Tax=Croceimicrobium hydrocarbonivorans TaxID=2761580 RepID=A0A7H0VDQ2_9FLAO|nr:hypothetical protein [Croceimicrobium hydrocarbonivorans]QNR23850.1 leucine-rich repeat domain-containing protein [Croceimicrobium hydrocarbonivorans]
MNPNRISRIKNNVQDRNSKAWLKLCSYVEELAKSGGSVFDPREALGDELYLQIQELPESIGQLKQVRQIELYGSKLVRIPPEIGQMEALEEIDLYTSYDLKWLPFEISHCKNLKKSRISTRALYGNIKNRKGFPRLDHNPVRYQGEKLHCSVCAQEISYETSYQMWISINVATDVMPLLVMLCSKECELKLPQGAEYHIAEAHRGGADLKQKPA